MCQIHPSAFINFQFSDWWTLLQCIVHYKFPPPPPPAASPPPPPTWLTEITVVIQELAIMLSACCFANVFKLVWRRWHLDGIAVILARDELHLSPALWAAKSNMLQVEAVPGWFKTLCIDVLLQQSQTFNFTIFWQQAFAFELTISSPVWIHLAEFQPFFSQQKCVIVILPCLRYWLLHVQVCIMKFVWNELHR